MIRHGQHIRDITQGIAERDSAKGNSDSGAHARGNKRRIIYIMGNILSALRNTKQLLAFPGTLGFFSVRSHLVWSLDRIRIVSVRVTFNDTRRRRYSTACPSPDGAKPFSIIQVMIGR